MDHTVRNLIANLNGSSSQCSNAALPSMEVSDLRVSRRREGLCKVYGEGITWNDHGWPRTRKHFWAARIVAYTDTPYENEMQYSLRCCPGPGREAERDEHRGEEERTIERLRKLNTSAWRSKIGESDG